MFFVVPVVGDLLNGAIKSAPFCRVISLKDGDTGELYCPQKGFVTARFTQFNTPEVFSPQCFSERVKGVAATQYLRWMLWTANEISARPTGQVDRYGRELVALAVDGKGVARPLVEAGLAEFYDGGLRRSWCE
ncbi:thermonuclease family protein [Shimia biformata]|uniref:thermonuclease family protein n=1 Tax=Shimia biformata TaxID=1294299 RepID=UPI001951613D|nr:thermonuclease family protein [Shimia biformata]